MAKNIYFPETVRIDLFNNSLLQPLFYIISGRLPPHYNQTLPVTHKSAKHRNKDIIRQIENGYKEISSSYITIVERSSAITYAVVVARPEDVVVIAGKGAEPYMDEGGVKRPYSDRAEVLEIFRRYNL